MTGYHIRCSYNSSFKLKEMNSKLEIVINDICANPERIADEVKRVEGREVPGRFIDPYRQPWPDLTIKTMKDCDGRLTVMQMASGGGEDRQIKESMRRAVCRMVMERMHASGMEVSISVH